MLYLIKQLQYKSYVKLETALAPLGVTTAQWSILATLAHSERRSSAELSRIFGVKPQTMIKQITLLEIKALIHRTVAEANKRVLEVELTEEGRAVLAQCDAVADRIEADLLGPLTEAERGLYRQFMATLVSHLKAPTPQESALTLDTL